MRLEYAVSPRRIALVLGGLAIYLALQSVIMEYLIENVLDTTIHANLIEVMDLFSVNTEQAIPTWFSVFLLLTAALLLANIAAVHVVRQERAVGWIGLALIFFYLALDEGAAIHEIASDVLEGHLSATGYIAFAWIVVAIPLVVIFGLIYLRFWWRLPWRTRGLFVLAAAIYVGGAIGVEAISANEWFVGGGVHFTYLAIATIEELCEMLGVVVFIYALLSYAAKRQMTFTFIPANVQPIPAPEWHQFVFTRVWLWATGLIASLILVANVILLIWASGQPPRIPFIEEPATPFQIILDQIPDEHVVMTRLDGYFGGDNARARDVVVALLSLYNDVLVLTLPSMDSSVIFAADELPFDAKAMGDMLRANGISQFVIFETPAVRVLVEQ